MPVRKPSNQPIHAPVVQASPPAGAEWRHALGPTILQSQLDRDAAGQILHDQLGPLLSAGGLQLKILSLDLPDSAALRSQVSEITRVLEKAIEETRRVSELLSSSGPWRVGMEYALNLIRAKYEPQFGGKITLNCGDNTPPEKVRRALATLADTSVLIACRHLPREISINVARTSLGWALEVLYYESSPTRNNVQLPSESGDDLVRLQYQALQFGLALFTENTSDGARLIRVSYSHDPDP